MPRYRITTRQLCFVDRTYYATGKTPEAAARKAIREGDVYESDIMDPPFGAEETILETEEV